MNSEGAGCAQNSATVSGANQMEAPDADSRAIVHDDSGHESNMSNTPELPSTPQEERSITPGEKNSEDADSLDSLFHIRILLPNSEPMEVQIGGSDMVQELYHVLLERDVTCTRTCFKIYYENKPLDHFTEIRNIAKIKNRAIFQVVEEPYNIREARIHIRHLREILRSLDRSDSVAGVDFEEVKRIRTEIKADMDCLPPEYLLPGSKDSSSIPLKPLIPNAPQSSKLEAIKFLATSPFNPPPGPRKMKGDILYLFVDTVEDRRFHITCSSRGFFVNATTDATFNPDPSNHNRGVFHSLFELLSELSSHFRRVFPQILKLRGEKHVYERLPHSQDSIRADDLTQPHRIGLEDHVPGQVRDWNEELQTTMDMPRTTFPERICRDRAKFKVHSDFLAASVRGRGMSIDSGQKVISSKEFDRLATILSRVDIWRFYFCHVIVTTSLVLLGVPESGIIFIRGAMNIIDGNILTINAMDDPKTHMFIWNNIFFSLGFDVKDHYKEVGGDPAAFAANTADLNAARAYSVLDHTKLHTLGMAIVDYKGLRLTAQSIIPGILEKDQEESVVYGSFDSGKTVVSSKEYEEFLSTSAKQLKIAPHSVWNGKEGKMGEYVKLYTSYESKGIIGNDGRYYLLDLLRTFPPDVNFLKDGEVTELCKANGFPRAFKHKLVTLRQELIDAFIDFRYIQFMRIVSTLIQKHCLEGEETNSNKHEIAEKSEQIMLTDGHEKVDDEVAMQAITSAGKISEEGANEVVKKELMQAESKENANQDELLKTVDKESDAEAEELSNKVVSEATRMLGSFSDHEFDIRFNPDCYSQTIKHSPEEDIPAQRKLVSDAAEFLLAQQIPLFVRDCSHQSINPVDGANLVEALHSRGINCRYLGKIIETIESVEGVSRISYVSTIAKVEVVSRCARRYFNEYIRNVPALYTGAAVAHFLNCLVGGNSQLLPLISTENEMNPQNQRKFNKRSKRKPSSMIIATGWDSNKACFVDNKQSLWRKLTQTALWDALITEGELHYGYKLEAENCDQFVLWSNAQKISIVRRICNLTGIQLLLKNYQLDIGKQKTQCIQFTEADVYNLNPVVKHLNPRAHDAYNLYLTALNKMQNGFPRIGYELMTQAHNMMSNIYGPLHPDLALCLRNMARMAFVLGDLPDALTQQHKAVMISERCGGLDNGQTIMDYVNCAHYSFANLHIVSALKLLYRSRFLLLVVYGEDHPVMAQIDANIGVILYSVQEYELALLYLNHALKLYAKYDVAFCLKTALLYHILARTHASRGEFRAALSKEKETFSIYSRIFGENHEKTRLSSECLGQLAKQAVNFQRRMNDVRGAATGQSLVHFIPTNIQQPSLQNIIETLNVFNNFIFLKIQTGGVNSEAPSKAENGGEEVRKQETEEESKMNALVLQEESLD